MAGQSGTKSVDKREMLEHKPYVSPKAPLYDALVDGDTVMVHCAYCMIHHRHGLGRGHVIGETVEHRSGHCYVRDGNNADDMAARRRGYNFRVVGRWSKGQQRAWLKELRRRERERERDRKQKAKDQERAEIRRIKDELKEYRESRRLRRPISLRQRFAILQRDRFSCQTCGRTMKDGIVLHVDHRIPVAKGGTSADENLWTLCHECNLGKHTTEIVE